MDRKTGERKWWGGKDKGKIFERKIKGTVQQKLKGSKVIN
jgi:hypothetical protein